MRDNLNTRDTRGRRETPPIRGREAPNRPHPTSLDKIRAAPSLMRDTKTQREDMDKTRDLRTALRENHITGTNVKIRAVPSPVRDIQTQREDMDKIRDLQTRRREYHNTGIATQREDMDSIRDLRTHLRESHDPGTNAREDSRSTSPPPLLTAEEPTPPDPNRGGPPLHHSRREGRTPPLRQATSLPPRHPPRNPPLHQQVTLRRMTGEPMGDGGGAGGGDTTHGPLDTPAPPMRGRRGRQHTKSNHGRIGPGPLGGAMTRRKRPNTSHRRRSRNSWRRRHSPPRWPQESA